MTNHSLSRFICLFSLMLNLLLAASPAQAQATPPVTVRVAPATIEIPLGQTADVAVEVVDVQDLYGFDLALTFNPSMVEIVDADPNQAGVQAGLGTFLDSGFVVLNAADNISGTLRFAMTQLNPSEPKSGSGALIVLRLRGKQLSGGTPLTLTNVQLARRDGSSLPTNSVSGAISVVSSASSAPTNTPIPTRGAGTPLSTSTPLSLPTTTATATIGSAAVAPTFRPLATGMEATITPEPTNQVATTIPGAPAQTSTTPSATNPQPGSARGTETPQPTSASSAPSSTESTNAPVAVAAATTSSPTPAGVRAAVQVTEQPAAPGTNAPGSAPALLALAGALGLVGIVTVWLVMRRRSQ